MSSLGSVTRILALQVMASHHLKPVATIHQSIGNPEATLVTPLTKFLWMHEHPTKRHFCSCEKGCCIRILTAFWESTFPFFKFEFFKSVKPAANWGQLLLAVSRWIMEGARELPAEMLWFGSWLSWRWLLYRVGRKLWSPSLAKFRSLLTLRALWTYIFRMMNFQSKSIYIYVYIQHSLFAFRFVAYAGVVFNGFLCNVKADAVGAWVELSTSSDCTVGLKAMSNPHVWRANPTAEMTQSLNFKVFHLSVLHLAASPPQCNLGTVVRSDVEIPGRYYMLQSRLELVENTIQKPASSGSWAGGTCPAVSKTFLNEGSCKLLPGCLPLGLVQVEVVLNPAAFEKFFSVSGRYVYAITGLRTSSGPCNRRSRWKKLDCSTESCSASSLSADDQQAIQSELAGASAQGWLRDVDISCSSNVAAQRVVEVGNDHFQHVHLDEFNTYDFTDWVSSHPGGPDKITQWTSQAALCDDWRF